ncbi:MAG: hypothetical protein H8D23_21870 [Candidatus Brocadiales bacterium]|nr:hypothetical protein [Candidatus Brocadiales bacterium]
MSIQQIEKLLFEQWQINREGFVRDGVVSETDYLSSLPKIVLILKEVNDPNGGGWDLRKFIADGGRPQTWDNIARWVYGIRNLTQLPNWDYFSKINNEFRIENLKSICVINLKKSPGTHTTNYASLEAVANEDKDNIRKQYSIYNPDVTICGGTGNLFKKVVGHESNEWRMTKKGIWWYERENRKYVVSFAHPEARVQSSLLVYGLLDAIREISKRYD